MSETKKSNLYTRQGDKGETGLVSGTRISKGSARLTLYGEVDELNSHIGIVVNLLDKKPTYQFVRTYLIEIQHLLFDLGSNLACEPAKVDQYNLPKISAESIRMMETKIDSIDNELPELRNFILPGGAFSAAHVHVCRTVTRRIERKMVNFEADGGELPEHSLELINRMSDYFFVLARYINYLEKRYDTQWRKDR